MKPLTLHGLPLRRAVLSLPLMLAGLAGAQTMAVPPGPGAAHMHSTMVPAPFYTVVNLGEGPVTPRVPVINRYGQVAYTLDGTGFFYDGARIFQIPGIAGASLSIAIGLNDKGQVVGSAAFDSTSDLHPFVWSKEDGIRDLLPLDDAPVAEAVDINNHGVSVGLSYRSRDLTMPVHAVRWKYPGSGLDLGSLGTGRSAAVAINDAGLVAGTSVISAGNRHAFAWTYKTGLIDIGTLTGGTYSEARAVDEFGEIAGNADAPNSRDRVFLWSRATGIRDLGAADGVSSRMLGMSSRGRIAGIVFTCGGEHAMTWTHATGMLDIGTLPAGLIAHAWAANNNGEVVGESLVSNQQPFHAFVWTAASGMIDLNKRVHNLPQGMLLQSAKAVSDHGSIVVQTNSGLVLLKPGRCDCGAAVGAIQATGTVVAGTPFMATASLADDPSSSGHMVSWSWGDGSSEPTHNAIERNGQGSSNASHVYSKPGIYEVSVKVTDKAGHSATVTRKVVVQGMKAPG